MRRVISFGCEGDTLMGTLDDAPGETGLLMVSGGNEIRVGAHRGMALLSQRLAEEGVPCFRYDRRGIGDSIGTNRGFEASGPDLLAAVYAFREEAPYLRRIVAYGNCDAASALALVSAEAGIDALVLSNPWIGAGGSGGDLPPAAAIKARYLDRLKRPAEWMRLLKGQVDFPSLIRGLTAISTNKAEISDLQLRMAHALQTSRLPTTILLAEQDNTAIAFREAWAKTSAPEAKLVTLDSASHSFAGRSDRDWLFTQLLAATR